MSRFLSVLVYLSSGEMCMCVCVCVCVCVLVCVCVFVCTCLSTYRHVKITLADDQLDAQIFNTCFTVLYLHMF